MSLEYRAKATAKNIEGKAKETVRKANEEYSERNKERILRGEREIGKYPADATDIDTPSGTEPLEAEGLSTHIETDRWTDEDTLGYRAYAYAIYRFIIHKNTKPPLTISIQAPWGGGKTSLMRMIQKHLDPKAFKKEKQEARQPRGDLTVRQTLEEIKSWIQNKTQEKLPLVPEDKERKRLTVWFNAWKYESTNQVWAGLVDAIMQQIAARLNPVERERFWLRLNLRRVDADKIRHKIYERVFSYCWRNVRKWLLGIFSFILILVGTTIVGAYTRHGLIQNLSWSGLVLSALTGIIATGIEFQRAKKKVEEEPAAVSLNKYLNIPNYNTSLGFIHHVEADLRRVLDSVPERDKENGIVIFIDDLDRCSPAKVGQVIEGVNLFLAGDLPKCVFVLGMDAEMVAAALQVAHKDMISYLPTDADIPIGWRFMNKFVQLPFIIPPVVEGDLTRYITALFSKDERQLINEKITKGINVRDDIASEIKRLQQEPKLNKIDIAYLAYLQEEQKAQVTERKLDEGIKRFSDKNPDIRNAINKAKFYFRGNPRELKRFINAFRFQYFLWWAHLAQEFQGPTLEQLLRWTVLSMKWPEVVRWLRYSSGNQWKIKPGDTAPTVTARLHLLEEISGRSTDLGSWHKQALEVLRLRPKTTPWLNDDDLLQFFHEEYIQYPEGERLSDAMGTGFW